MKSDMIRIKRIFGCFLFILLAGVASAQDRKISLRTLQLGGDKMPEAWVWVAGAKEPMMLTWLTSQPNEPIQVVHNGQLKLFRQTQDAAGKTVLEIKNTVRLPNAAKEALLLGWTDGEESKYVAIEDRFLNAKFNDWLAINTSVNDVAILAGKDGEPIRINPGKSVIFQPRIEKNKGVKVLAQTMRKGELKTFLSSYWPAFPGQRTVIIFYDDGDRMRAKRIGDRFLRKEAKP